MLVQGVAVQNRKVIEPSIVLDHMGIPNNIIDSLFLTTSTTNTSASSSSEEDTRSSTETDDDDNSSNSTTMLLLKRFNDLDKSFREEATLDDDKRIL